VSPNGESIYLTATYANEIWALRADTLKPAAKSAVARGPHGIAVSSDGAMVFTASRGAAVFTVLSAPTLKETHSFKLGTGPGHVGVAPGGKHVYINDEADFRTYIYDPATRKVIHTVHLWPEPHETAFYIPAQR